MKIMKKLLILLIPLVLLILASCTDENGETEPETHPPVEITTAAPVSMEEMSPSEMNVTAPDGIEMRISDIDFDSFREIEAEDSFFPASAHDRILESENAQYFFVADDIKIHAVFFDENKKVTLSASYNTETGFAEFMGDAEKSWYFGKTGELECFVYTYDFGGQSDAPIYTFYSPDGKKEVTRTINGWYSPELDMLSNDEIMDCLKKYAATIEATAEYQSSDITNK